MKYTTQHLLAAGASAVALMAGPAQADQVFFDDVIAVGSICAGLDCSNGESFGFDTIRMKENNLRIKAQDTSTSASFPTRDWQITFNDSSNGGANKFSIDDIDGGRTPFTIEAGTPSHALYVDDGGRIGLGTSTPVVQAHIVDGNSPTLRLQQDGTSGFTPQTWDVASNEANFFIRDATNGSKLSFRIRPSAPESSIDIQADGDIGLGTSSPDAGLHITRGSLLVETGDGGAPSGTLHTRGAGTQLAYFESTDNGAVQVRLQSDSGNRRLLATNSDDVVDTQIVFDTNEIRLAGTTDTGGNLWATISAAGITTLGPDCSGAPCDRTFDPDYFEVPAIEEHAEYMWDNMHLKAVGPTGPDQPYNVTQKTAGMLHELEVAHIYIEQLNTRVKELEALVEGLK